MKPDRRIALSVEHQLPVAAGASHTAGSPFLGIIGAGGNPELSYHQSATHGHGGSQPPD